jgi:hypothetical protein
LLEKVTEENKRESFAETLTAPELTARSEHHKELMPEQPQQKQ